VNRKTRAILTVLAVSLLLRPAPILACAACYGASDSPMAQGMNWGIFTLLGVVGGVLGGIAGFFVFLARRSASQSQAPVAAHQSPITSH